MFQEYTKGVYSVQEIMNCQESVFGHFLAFPNEQDRYLSPFRLDDNTPGCRFSYQNGVWYFIDNATYNNRLRFNCIDFVMAFHNIRFQEAINLISEEVTLVLSEVEPPKFIPEIKVKLKLLDETNYFTRKLGLPVDYLHAEKVGWVTNYWANTRKYNYLKLNSYYNPKQIDTYCYVTKMGIELYFPDQEMKYVKVGSSDYVSNPCNTSEYEIWVEGNKDRMVLNYHYSLPVRGLHNVHSTPKVDKNKLIILLLDPDKAGIDNAIRLEKEFPNSINLTSISNKDDIANLYINNKTKLDEIVKLIQTCVT